MSSFIAAKSSETWHKHPVVINQTKTAAYYHYIPMLKITVSNADLLQRSCHIDKTHGEIKESTAVKEMLLDIYEEGLTFNPLHLQKWIIVVRSPDTFREELEAHQVWALYM
jgi:hypothetical protein